MAFGAALAVKIEGTPMTCLYFCDFNFETEEQCEIAAKHLHGHEYVEGGCFNTYQYVLKAPLSRPDELWRSVSKGVE